MGALEIFTKIKRYFGTGSEDGEVSYTPSALETPSVGIQHTRFADLLPYLAFDNESGLFVLEGDEENSIEALGFVLEMMPQTGAPQEMAELLTSVFIGVPPGTSFQWSLFGTPLVDPFVSAYEAQRLSPESFPPGPEREQSRLYRELFRRRANHFRKGATLPLIQNTPYLLRDLRLIMAVTVPAKDMNDKALIQTLRTMRETYITTLQTYSQYSHTWGPEDLINWCATLLNPHQALQGEAVHLRYDNGRKIANQIVSPETVIRVTDKGLRFGLPQDGNDLVAHVMSVRSYPPSFTLNGMGQLIGDWTQAALGYPCPFLITLVAVTVDYEENRNKTQMKQARATQNAESPMAKFLPDLAEKKRDWDIAQFAFDDGKGTVQMLHQIVLFAPPEKIHRARQSAIAVWRNKQFEIVSDTYMQLQGMLGSLPMAVTASLTKDIKNAQRWSTKTTFNAVNTSPLLGEWCGFGKPIVALWGRRGQAMGFDLFANDSGNYNACVVGTSGSGKSVFLNDLSLSYLSIGGRVWIIDVGRSYEKLCHTVGGQYIEFTPEANICLNPFSMIHDLDDFDDQMGMLRELLAQMISPSAPLNDYEKTQIEIHLRSVYYEHGPNMTMDHLAHSLINNCEKGGPNPQAADEEYKRKIAAMSPEEREKVCDPTIRRLGVQLTPYTTDGSYGRYFNGPANIEFKSNFIVLELEELASKPDLQAVVMFLLMYKITDAMYLSRSQKKLCIIDEAWALLSGGNSSQFIETGYRRARKYNGSFITGTQGIGDYSKSPAAEAALNNADWMFMLRQKPESIESLSKSGKLLVDEELKKMLLSVTTRQGSFSEVLVHCGQKGYGIGRVFFDPFSLLLTSSKAEDFEAVNEYRKRGLSVSEAIEAVLEDRGVNP